MNYLLPTIALDGNDKIVYSETFNVYENRLTIPDILGFKVNFVFEKTDPTPAQNDITVSTVNSKEVLITLSNKFRNALGAGTTSKLGLLNTSEGKQVLFSIFGQQVGNSDCLHVTVNFYLR